MMNINLRSIPAFQKISDLGIENIQKDAEVLRFPIGHPLSKRDIIPNKIFIILSGEARLLHIKKEDRNTLKSITIVKLKSDTFIGLASLLRAKACEFITASSEVMVLAISDSLILNLYKEELEFRDWCNTNIQSAEAYFIASQLQEKSIDSEISIKKSFDLILKNAVVKTLEDGQLVKLNKDFITILGSDNVIERKILDSLDNNEKLITRGPLPARLFEFPKNIYSQLTKTESIDGKQNTANESIDLKDLDIKEGPGFVGETSQKLGQYAPIKEYKVIRASGLMRESLACLQMISNDLKLPYRGDSIEKILSDTIKRGKKPTIQLLGGITSMMGLYSSTGKLAPKMGDRLPSPSIITWGESFAVVKESNARFLEIVSPIEGMIRIKPEEFEEKFQKGFIEILMLQKNEQTPESKFGVQWLWPSIKRHKGSLFLVLFASFVVQLLGLANPLMIQVVIDKVLNQRSLDTLGILGGALVVVTILTGVLGSLRTFLFAETTNRIDTRLGAEVIDHLLRLPLNYFDKRPVGELGSRIAELEKIRNFLTGQALTTILDAAFSLIYIIVMVMYSWLLSFIALGVVPIQIIIAVVGTPLIRRQIRQVAVENASTQSHLVEVLTGIQTVKAQNVERVSRWKWQDLYSKYISRSFEKTMTGTALGSTSQVLQQLSQLLVLWAGATLVLEGRLTLGQLIAFRMISGYVTMPLLRLSTIWQNVQELRVSFERLADIIDTPTETTETDKAKIPLPSLEGCVEFENVSFAFNHGQPEVLKKVNLKIEAGQFVGIVGQSGSGKSTLMKLLPRLYKPDSGRLMIDNYDVNKVELYSLRRQIGIVPQEPLLFAGTVTDNIALTEPEAPSDEIVEVSRIADAHDFIMGLQDGYSTKLGERGAGLSGGQKQRIAIARTLLNKPRLLIMDEATSALDYETERRVCEGLRRSCTNSTVFFITHRLSTVRNADLIVMLHQGSIVEIGTHKELMDIKGRYFALYRQQESS